MGNLKTLQNYFSQNMGAFYVHGANRLMLYPFIFSLFLVECGSFWLLYLGPSFVMDYMAFTTVYTLHKAAVYSICIFVADAAAHHLAKSICGYSKRTVGRQWIIWSIGLAAGFGLQRTMIKSLVIVYAPDAVAYFTAHPQVRLDAITLLAILIPYWGVVMLLTTQIALSKQRVLMQARAIRVVPEEDLSENRPLIASRTSLPSGSLQVSEGNVQVSLALSSITHITVEDHYCRVNYATGNGPKSRLIRIPLKEMLKKLPSTHFFQIHRSHVVNLGHVERVAKNGRDHKAIMQSLDAQLPISRSRFKQLPPLRMVARNES